ncbi:hypothetical protein HK100_006086 [Physocladia obscura]|uniref:Uroporphyrinogen decarboxylase n=1 Tax=Physocladia obscura TaxID=109957 RepID=A0AAD5SWI2_9FUNG|nr:hypothetical protein HK100_006086 [Physocladia obscura]
MAANPILRDSDFPALKNNLIIRAAKGETIERTPVWIMRQAGRYLPEFREARKRNDFFTICRNPELACEVTLQPIDRYAGLLDASIIFSDILVIPQAMASQEVQMLEKVGPFFPQPLITPADLARLTLAPNVHETLQYVFDAITLTRTKLDGRVPLIGFTGAPWTLMAYMIEGQGSKTYAKAKAWLYKYPVASKKLLSAITDLVVEYLVAQVKAGAQMLQVFDSNSGELGPDLFNEFLVPGLLQIAEKVKSKLKDIFLDVPIIIFARNSHYALETLSKSAYNVIQVDFTLSPEFVHSQVQRRKVIQGNADPSLLYADPENIRKVAEKMLDGFGTSQGYIANLGHGMYPDHDPEHLKAYLQSINENSDSLQEKRDSQLEETITIPTTSAPTTPKVITATTNDADAVTIDSNPTKKRIKRTTPSKTPSGRKPKAAKSNVITPRSRSKSSSAVFTRKNWHLELYPSPPFATDLTDRERTRKGDGPENIAVNVAPVYTAVRPNATRDFKQGLVRIRDEAVDFFVPTASGNGGVRARKIICTDYASEGRKADTAKKRAEAKKVAKDADDMDAEDEIGDSDIENGSERDGSHDVAVLPPFESIGPLLPGEMKRKKFVLNVAGSVWGLDWANVDESEQYMYLAIAGYPTTIEKNYHLGVKQVKTSEDDNSLNGCLQIWKLDHSGDSTPTLEICFLMSCGVIYGLEWASQKFYEPLEQFNLYKQSNRLGTDDLPRLGLLAASFGDGSCRIINVPHPKALKESLKIPENESVFVKYDRFIFTAALPETLLWKPCWIINDALATGCANADPLICFPAHNTAVSKIFCGDQSTLYGAPQLFTCGYDGQMLIHDPLRDPWNSVQAFKVRGIITSAALSPQLNAYCVMDTDNSVRFFRPGTLPEDGGDAKDFDEGTHFKSRNVAIHMGGVWDIDISRNIPFVASVGVDGCAKMSNLNRTITKTFRPIQTNLYQLGYCGTSGDGVFKYIEETPEEQISEMTKNGESAVMIFAPEIALQQVKWNQNRKGMKWIASGGAAGLVRVESTFDEAH